jgi:hypothetical protein
VLVIVLIMARAVEVLVAEAVDAGEGEVALAGRTTESRSTRSRNIMRGLRGTIMMC